MRIYYVIPPKGRTYYSQADALTAFETGEVWRCTGWADVNEDTAKPERITKLKGMKWLPIRYSRGNTVTVGDTQYHMPRAFAMQWRPGRVSFQMHRVSKHERMVPIQYGPGQGKALIEERKTSGHEKFQARRVTGRQMAALKEELNREGGWMTSAGLRFRPVLPNERMGLDPFPMITWHERSREEKMAPVYLDANPACRTLGDRELERWYTSAQYRAYNSFARRLTRNAGGFSEDAGNYRTAPAPDPDYEHAVYTTKQHFGEGYDVS